MLNLNPPPPRRLSGLSAVSRLSRLSRMSRVSLSRVSLSRVSHLSRVSRMSRGTRPQRGFSMLETLVTLLIIAIWLLGSAGVQTIAMKLNKTSAIRNQAILLAAEVGERMENNRSAGVGAYNTDGSQPSSAPDCFGSACTPSDLVKFDKSEIYQRAAADNATVTITTLSSTSTTVTYSILVQWTDRRGGQTYGTTGTTEVGQYTSIKTIYFA